MRIDFLPRVFSFRVLALLRIHFCTYLQPLRFHRVFFFCLSFSAFVLLVFFTNELHAPPPIPIDCVSGTNGMRSRITHLPLCVGGKRPQRRAAKIDSRESGYGSSYGGGRYMLHASNQCDRSFYSRNGNLPRRKTVLCETLAYFAFGALAAPKQRSHTLAKRKSRSTSVTCVCLCAQERVGYTRITMNSRIEN
jgi:hypothetical protein